MTNQRHTNVEVTVPEGSNIKRSIPNSASFANFKNKLKFDWFKQMSKTQKRVLFVVPIAVAIITFVVFQIYSNSETGMKRTLENYATKIYNKNLKGGNSNSYTINLNYLERNGYNISAFNRNNCSKTGTYAVININRNSDIETIVTQLKCGEDK